MTDDEKYQLIKRFEKNFKVLENGCWQWTLKLNEKGYSSFPINKLFCSGHRASMFIYKNVPFRGIKEVADHLCRNRGCVNPDHIEMVTHRTNTMRGIGLSSMNDKKEICIRGHDLVAPNLRIHKMGFRECRACEKIRWAERWKIKKALKNNLFSSAKN